MQAEIHPASQFCSVKCSCGNEFKIISEQDSMQVEICSACHPYYTGQQKFIDSAGRVDRFTQRYKLNDDKLAKLASKKEGTKRKNEKLAHKINPKKKKPTAQLQKAGDEKGKDKK